MIPDFLMHSHVLQSFLSPAEVLSLIFTCKYFYTNYFKSSLLILWKQHAGLSNEYTMTKTSQDRFFFYHLKSIFPIFHQFILYQQSFNMNIIFLEQIKSLQNWFYDIRSLPFHDGMWFHLRSIYGIHLDHDHWWKNILKLVYPKFAHESLPPISFRKQSSLLYDLCEGIIYFEINILIHPHNQDDHSCLSIGFSTAEDFVLLNDYNSFLGWSDASIGLHSDDGHLYCKSKSFSVHHDNIMAFGEGDVVGAGICFKTKTFFFTMNGKKYIHISWKDWGIYETLYPTVVMDQLWQFEMNFGDRPFLYPLH